MVPPVQPISSVLPAGSVTVDSCPLALSLNVVV
jgi:hypothetical protein